MPPRKTIARRPGQGQPKSTADALKRSGQQKPPQNRPARYIAAETGTGTSRGRHGGTTPGSKTGGQAIRHVSKGTEERARLYKYDGWKQSPLTTGDALRSAARARTIAKWKGIQKKRAASYKPKYRMGSRGGPRKDT
jgi:hypothetical protein